MRMAMTMPLALLASFPLFIGVGCGPPSRNVVVTGSSTVAPLVNEIARRFESMHPGVRVDVQTGGSSRGLADARKGLADLGMVSRALFADERDVTAHVIALDGLCMVVNAQNRVRRLSDEQVREVYVGRIRNWRDLGGDDAPIVVVNKAEGRATLELFLAHFGLKNSEIRADVVVGDNEQGVKTLSGNPHAIGYVSIGAAEYQERVGTPIRRLPSGDGVEATLANVANGTYPILRPLNLVSSRLDTSSGHGALVQDFVRFARSSAVHDLVEGLYFVPVEP